MTARRKRWTWRNVLVVVLAGLAAAVGSWLPGMLFDQDPAASPRDPCALIAEKTLALVVPSPKVTRSEASNDGPYTTYGYCDVETDSDRATSSARAWLSVDIERSGSVGYLGPAESARHDFTFSKRYSRDEGDRLSDVRNLGDSAYVQIEADEDEEDQWSVRLHVLAGSDEIEVGYSAGPTDDELALAAAIAVARSVTKGLAR